MTLFQIYILTIIGCIVAQCIDAIRMHFKTQRLGYTPVIVLSSYLLGTLKCFIPIYNIGYTCRVLKHHSKILEDLKSI